MARAHHDFRSVLGVVAALVAMGPSATAQDSWEEFLGEPVVEQEWRCYTDRDPLLEQEVFELVAGGLSGERPEAEVVAGLAQLGAPAVPLLFAMLLGEVVDQDGRGLREAWSEEAAVLGDADRPTEEQLLCAALAAMPADAVLGPLRTAATGEAPTAARLLAARVLEGVADPRALAVLLEVAGGIEPVQLQTPYARRPLSEAFEVILRRNPMLVRDLADRLEDVDVRLVELICATLPEEHAHDGLTFLLSLFGRDPQLDLASMENVSRLAGAALVAGDLWSGLDCVTMVRRQLHSEDWHMRRLAIVAAVKLRDLESLDLLVEHLADEQRAVQSTALWGLRELSGQAFDADPARWKTWIDSERAWFDGPRTEIEWRILSGQDAEIIAGIRELLGHPLFRDSAADLLGPLLAEAPAGVFDCARAALVQLGSAHAVPFLIEGLDSQDEAKLSGSWAALKSLTSLELPPERAAWEGALGI